MSQISPRLIKGGLVLLDPSSGATLRVIPLQYNPQTVSRSLAPQSVEATGGDRSQALRLTGPPIETIRLEAELDATDRLETPDQNRNTVEFGLFPDLAALELIVYPTTAQLKENDGRAKAGMLEITPLEAPLTVFVWSKSRVMPVRITELSIEEEFFDTQLNPIRARVSLSLRVLSVNDLGFRHRGSGLYLLYQGERERLAALSAGGRLSDLGIERIPL
ncbi:MAG: hypothetical protein K1X74_16665 [Pirellulales bacterium]|nr:hypothetical protein [Pirellulales bacterium]